MATRPNLDNLDFLGRALDFIETYNFDQELLKDVVRYPTSREKDPHSNDVGYPIYRFRRGDITVTCGFRDPEHPHILHVVLHTPEDNESHFGNAPGGSGVSKTPTSLTQVRGWLQRQGCKLEMTNTGQRVTYNEVFIGVLHQTMKNPRQYMNFYTRAKNKIAAIKAQDALRQDVMDREMP